MFSGGSDLAENACIRQAAVGLSKDAACRCKLNTGLLIALDHPETMEHRLAGDGVLEPARTAARCGTQAIPL